MTNRQFALLAAALLAVAYAIGKVPVSASGLLNNAAYLLDWLEGRQR